MRNYPDKFESYISYVADVNDFYKNIKNTNFAELNKEKLKELKYNSTILYKLLKNPKLPTNKTGKYIKIMNSIKTNPKGFGATNEAEKFIFFMFCIDPSFEAAKIAGECNTIQELKEKMINYFGIFDKRLIKIENLFIKNFLSKKQKTKIQDEIEKRVFK